MLLSAVDLDSRLTTQEQLLIVGAGAVGLSMAVDLARRGKSVTVLEAGPEMVSNESQIYFGNARSTSRHLEGLHLGRFRALGGTTNFWGGQLVPFDPIVFGAREWIGEDVAWPVSRDDLNLFYDRALDLFGMHEARITDKEVQLRLGIATPTLPEALAFFFTRWIPEPNLYNLFKREIHTLTNLRVITGAPVVALVSDACDERVGAVDIIDSNWRRIRLRAETIVLANGTIEIARLLSLPYSDGQNTPWSKNKWLGTGFMDHLDITAGTLIPRNNRAIHQLFDNALLDGIKYQPKIKLSEEMQQRQRLLGIAAHLIFKSSLSDDFVNAKLLFKGLFKGRIDRGMPEILTGVSALCRLGIPMAARYLRHRRIYSPADRGVQLRLTAEQRSVPQSRIRLRAEFDDLGVPLVEIDWRVDGLEIETIARFSEMLRDYFESSALAEVHLDPRILDRDSSILDAADDANHHMGMARMSHCPGQGVVDSNLKVFGSRNLYVAGAAVYPSTGFANPTFTAVALGLRLAAFLRKD